MDSVYALGKLDKVKIDLVFVHVVDIQATIMQVEDSDVKMVVEINELQVVVTLFVPVTIVETDDIGDLSKDVTKNLKHFSNDFQEHHIY